MQSYNTIKASQNDVKQVINNNNNYINTTGAPLEREENGAPDASALTTHHKCRKFYDDVSGKVVIYSQGSLLKVSKGRKNPYEGSKRDWSRDVIRGFSVASRRRLMRTLGKVNKTERPQFVSLTYHNEWPEDPEDWKKQLKKFCQRLKYRFPKFAAVWKLEFQKRGAPHFHLLVWGLPTSHLKDYIALMWYEVVGIEDEDHLKEGSRIENIKSWRGVMSYASKYLGKSQEENNEILVGRFWGIFNRAGVPWSDEVIYFVTQSQIIMAMRYMRRYAGLRSRDYSSLTIFINSPPEWKRALLG